MVLDNVGCQMVLDSVRCWMVLDSCRMACAHARSSVLLMLAPSSTRPAPSSTQHFPAPSGTQHYPAPSIIQHHPLIILLVLTLVSCSRSRHLAPVQHPSSTRPTPRPAPRVTFVEFTRTYFWYCKLCAEENA